MVLALRTSRLLPQGTGDAVRLEATLISKVHAGSHKVKLQSFFLKFHAPMLKSSPLLIFRLLIIVMFMGDNS